MNAGGIIGAWRTNKEFQVRQPYGYGRGFTLIELMAAVAIVGFLAAVALPSYRNYIIRAARVAAQAELLEMASLQEKIFLNSSSYAFRVTANYTGTSTGGLGRTTETTKDGRYTIRLVTSCAANPLVDAAAPAQTFSLVAVPITSTTQAGDENLCVTESGRRTWGTQTW